MCKVQTLKLCNYSTKLDYILTKLVTKIQQQVSITVFRGQNRKICVLPQGQKYTHPPPSFLRFTPCENFNFPYFFRFRVLGTTISEDVLILILIF